MNKFQHIVNTNVNSTILQMEEANVNNLFLTKYKKLVPAKRLEKCLILVFLFEYIIRNNIYKLCIVK